MSNRRRAARRNTYRTGYLRSRQWFARRDRWFQDQQRTAHPLRCVGCGRVSNKRHLELHHVSYDGVLQLDGRWRAAEADNDLWPMHPACHELLHRVIDRDPVLSRHRTREAASRYALRIVRERFSPKEAS